MSEMSKLDEMSKELEELSDTLLKLRVSCQVLEVELCTIWSPYMVGIIDSATVSCKECSESLAPDEESLCLDEDGGGKDNGCEGDDGDEGKIEAD